MRKKMVNGLQKSKMKKSLKENTQEIYGDGME